MKVCFIQFDLVIIGGLKSNILMNIPVTSLWYIISAIGLSLVCFLWDLLTPNLLSLLCHCSWDVSLPPHPWCSLPIPYSLDTLFLKITRGSGNSVSHLHLRQTPGPCPFSHSSQVYSRKVRISQSPGPCPPFPPPVT